MYVSKFTNILSLKLDLLTSINVLVRRFTNRFALQTSFVYHFAKVMYIQSEFCAIQYCEILVLYINKSVWHVCMAMYIICKVSMQSIAYHIVQKCRNIGELHTVHKILIYVFHPTQYNM